MHNGINAVYRDYRQEGIPQRIIDKAFAEAKRVTPPCPNCAGGYLCRCYVAPFARVFHGWIRDWERRRFLRLIARSAAMVQQPISIGARMLLEDASRHPERRHPEPLGFEIDHEEGERWRRFK